MTKKGGTMRRSIVGLLVGISLSVIAGVQAASAVSSEGWGSKTAFVTSRIELDELAESYPCEGSVGFIQVKGISEFNDACIQGSTQQVKMARFIYAGVYKYAVSFPYDTQFYEVRGLCSHPRCVYASSTDTFITHTPLVPWRYGALVYKNFSKSLIRYFDTTTLTPYFQFQPKESPFYTVKIGDYLPSVEAVTVSANGKWALFELKGYGIVRLNLDTSEVKRILAPGAEYGMGRDPTFELAITDDGREVAIGGRGVGLSVLEIKDACGDGLTQGMEIYFSSGVLPCVPTSINTGELFPGLSYATALRFDEDGKNLGFIARYGNGKIEKATLSPFVQGERSEIPYLALGDSFTSGEGESSDSFYQPGTNEPYSKCHVSSRSYPYLLGVGWNKQTKSVACSGAQTIDILGSATYAGQADNLARFSDEGRVQLKSAALTSLRPGILPQREFVAAYQPQLITVSIGGNDAGLVGKLTGCLSLGTCEWASDPLKRYATSEEIASVYPKIREVLKKLRADSPVAQIAVVGYPQIINAAQNARCDELMDLLLDGNERQFIYQTIHYLNAVVHAAAYAEGFGFIDIEESLKGHELCGEHGSTAMNAVRIGDDIAPIKKIPSFTLFGAESFHPTPTGHRLIADSILKKYGSTNLISACSGGCLANGAVPEPSSYWDSGELNKAAMHKQVEDTFISDPLLVAGGEYAIKSAPHSFTPGSNVSLELHSEPISLAEVRANAEGEVSVAGILPSTIPSGYHVLHLLGTSSSGEAIDVYRTVFIQDVSISSSASAVVSAGSPLLPHSASLVALAQSPTPQSEVLGSSLYIPSYQVKPFPQEVHQPREKWGNYLWIFLGLIVGSALLLVIVVRYCFRHSGG